MYIFLFAYAFVYMAFVFVLQKANMLSLAKSPLVWPPNPNPSRGERETKEYI